MNESKPGLRELFEAALEFEQTTDRQRYLRERCEDQGLRDQVEDLLRSLTDVGDFLESPPAFASSPALGPEDQVGPFRLIREIGSGGMGVVFEVEQTQPIRRKVALKILKAGLDTGQVIARFEAERRVLALMDHPNIARVIDAGATDSGHPYFAMELVAGEPITQACDRARLTIRNRLELFVLVCRAIQHAHQKGIIHRDIKPSNVLLTTYDGRLVPKVIDFGISKAIAPDLADSAPQTLQDMIVGTLDSMSPEQAGDGSRGIDTRTDVYGLGVLLYELLTGTIPLGRDRLRNDGYDEILRRIREEVAPSPSVRVARAIDTDQASVAAARSTEPSTLVRLIRGDLDWITTKAIDKERERRYAGAEELARDIERYLASEPVEAGPPSAWYRSRTFARKHRVALVTGAAFVVVLITTSALSLRQAIIADRERSRAVQSEGDAQAVLGYFRDRVLAAPRSVGRRGGLGGTITLAEAIDAAEPGIDREFEGRPAVEAVIRDTIGTTYLDLGNFPAAILEHERALELRRKALGADAADTLTSMNNLALSHQAAGQMAKAVELGEEVLRRTQATRGPDHPATLKAMSNLAVFYRRVNRPADAIGLLERVADRRLATLGPDHSETRNAWNNLAVAYQSSGRAADAIKVFERQLDRARKTLGSSHPDTLISANNLAAAYQSVGRDESALTLLEEVYRVRRETPGADHPDTLTSANNLATSYRKAGRSAEAIARFEDVLARRRSRIGAEHPDTLATLGNLISTLLEQSRFADALEPARECLRLRTKIAPDDWRRYLAMSQLGLALSGLRRFDEAETNLIGGYRGLVEKSTSIPRSRKSEIRIAAQRVARLYRAWAKSEEAAAWDRTVEAIKSTP